MGHRLVKAGSGPQIVLLNGPGPGKNKSAGKNQAWSHGRVRAARPSSVVAAAFSVALPLILESREDLNPIAVSLPRTKTASVRMRL